MSTGRESGGGAEFEAAVHLTPEDPDYHVNLGLALAQRPGRTSGRDHASIERALRTDP